MKQEAELSWVLPLGLICGDTAGGASSKKSETVYSF